VEEIVQREHPSKGVPESEQDKQDFPHFLLDTDIKSAQDSKGVQEHSKESSVNGQELP
jgi:hypothetical protein